MRYENIDVSGHASQKNPFTTLSENSLQKVLVQYHQRIYAKNSHRLLSGTVLLITFNNVLLNTFN